MTSVSKLDILYRSTKLEKDLNELKRLVRRYGKRQGELIALRLTQLRAAPTLAAISTLPPIRCHELVANRQGQISIDMVHPYRLIFEPANNPLPTREDGGLNWSAVTIVRILEIEDTHG